MLRLLNKVSDGLNRFCEILVVFCIILLVGIMSFQVFTRFVLGHALTWADGSARYLLIWSTFLGAAIAAKEADHISLTFVLDRLRGKGRIAGDLVVTLLFAALAVAVVISGVSVVELVLPQKSDTLPISVAWIYGAIPFCEAIIAYHLLVSVCNKAATLMSGEQKEAGAE